MGRIILTVLEMKKHEQCAQGTVSMCGRALLVFPYHLLNSHLDPLRGGNQLPVPLKRPCFPFHQGNCLLWPRG